MTDQKALKRRIRARMTHAGERYTAARRRVLAQADPEIARWLQQQHGVDAWWSQQLTVGYEIAIGRRVTGQRSDGFAATASKTVALPVERLHAAFVDQDLRQRWLPDAPLRLRSGTPPPSANFEWEPDDTRVTVGFEAKGETKSSVGLEHGRLPDLETADRMKSF